MTTGRVCGSPYDSEQHAAGASSPYGLVDLVGNVWQYTADEFEDGHTRFVLVRGGSHYNIRHVSNWYFPTGDWRVRASRFEAATDWPVPSSGADPAERPAAASRIWQVDRHNRYNLMDDAWERAATIGFRCAYAA